MRIQLQVSAHPTTDTDADDALLLCSAVLQLSPLYIAEKRGNLQHTLDVFAGQRRYIEAYYAAITAYSSEDTFEANHWPIHAGLAGKETAHLHPFRSRLLRAVKVAGIESVQDYKERYDRWPVLKGMRQGGTCVSTDGLSHFMPTEYMTTLFFSMMALVSPAIQQQPVDLSYIDVKNVLNVNGTLHMTQIDHRD